MLDLKASSTPLVQLLKDLVLVLGEAEPGSEMAPESSDVQKLLDLELLDVVVVRFKVGLLEVMGWSSAALILFPL